MDEDGDESGEDGKVKSKKEKEKEKKEREKQRKKEQVNIYWLDVWYLLANASFSFYRPQRRRPRHLRSHQKLSQPKLWRK